METHEHVILLHGLGRTHWSMLRMARTLAASGYRVSNLRYPSHKRAIEYLATNHLSPTVQACRENGADRVHFVTHSLGAILVRYYLAKNKLDELGRVVMLAPPNAGSELADRLADLALFQFAGVPAGQQLGTSEDSLPNRLGPVDYPVGIIAGSRSMNPLLSLFIPGTNDGKVSVDRTRLPGMTDFLVVPYTHTMLMNRYRVIRQTRHFLRQGKFLHSSE